MPNDYEKAEKAAAACTEALRAAAAALRAGNRQRFDDLHRLVEQYRTRSAVCIPPGMWDQANLTLRQGSAGRAADLYERVADAVHLCVPIGVAYPFLSGADFADRRRAQIDGLRKLIEEFQKRPGERIGLLRFQALPDY